MIKKILCAIIGLLFAVPSFANCNLFDMSQTPYNSGELIIAATVGQTGFSTSVNTNYNVYRIEVQPNTTYTFGKIKASQPYWVVTDSSNKVLQTAQNNGGTEGVDITITTEASAKYLYLSVGINGTYKCDDILQLEQGDVATSYVPYNPNCGCDGTVMNYTSATGTVTQNGTPTPTNPITPTFYTQGNMVLRKVGDYADTYDATTGKITRKVGVKVFDGTENWGVFSTGAYATNPYFSTSVTNLLVGGNQGTILFCNMLTSGNISSSTIYKVQYTGGGFFVQPSNDMLTVENFKSWLAQQYRAGTPLTIWYPLADEVVEDWPASQCQQNIRVATTKYVETEFNPLNTTLANAVATVNTVVTQTIAQAASIATLQSGKQTRPADNTECPAYKQCLLVEDESGTPHWYQITDPFRDFVAPIIANNVGPASTTNQPGYTQLEYIESTGTQYIDTGIIATNWDWSVEFEMSVPQAGDLFFGAGSGLWSYTNWGAQFGLANSSGNTNWGAGSGGMNVVISVLGVRTNTFYNYKITKEGLYVNGELKSQNTATESFSNSDLSLWICKTNNAGGSGYSYNKTGSSWKYVRIYNANNALVFNGIPAKRNSDNAIGMYDTVGGRFYGNANTSGDDFTPGPVVANTDVPTNPTWTATWAANATTGVAAGTITGEGLCNAVAGTANTAATSAQMSSANWSVDGANCWCRATGVEEYSAAPSSISWVFRYAGSSAADCALNCAYACAARVRDNASFRSALFGM